MQCVPWVGLSLTNKFQGHWVKHAHTSQILSYYHFLKSLTVLSHDADGNTVSSRCRPVGCRDLVSYKVTSCPTIQAVIQSTKKSRQFVMPASDDTDG
jgi:hypothetical protein